MNKFIALACLLFVAAAGAMAQEYTALVYFSDGEQETGSFLGMNANQVNLRFNGQTQGYAPQNIGVVIFDNNFTNFKSDWNLKNNASPHTVILKNNTVIYGQITYIQPGGQIMIAVGNGQARYNAADVARFYLNPVELFKNARVHSANELVVKNQGNNNARPNNVNKGGGNKGTGNQGNNQQFSRLGGGEVLITFRNGSTTRGLIYDAMGNPLQLQLRDGRKFPMSNIYQINYFETRPRYPEDNNLQRGAAVIIFRNGGSTSGQILDYKGQDQWELADGRMIPASQIARIVFR